jgi:hypothetical protein
MESTIDSFNVNKARLEDEKRLDTLLSSPEFRTKALTAEDHHEFMDKYGNTKTYPGAEIIVPNMHMALSVVRRLYREVGARTDEDASNAFNHETAHFAEALNQGVDEKKAKIKIYLLRGDSTPTINTIELRIALPLPENLTNEEKSKAIALIALAPENHSPGDLKLADL